MSPFNFLISLRQSYLNKQLYSSRLVPVSCIAYQNERLTNFRYFLERNNAATLYAHKIYNVIRF